MRPSIGTLQAVTPHHAHCIERRRRLGMGTFRLRLAMRHYRHCCQLPQDGGAQLRGNSVLHPDGAVRTGSIQAAFRPLPTACYWIIAEGVCYITGAAFYSLRKARYMHSVFHFFVLGGSACHMVAVWDILVKML